jgi:Anti-sigma-K factor rskA, C-terminal
MHTDPEVLALLALGEHVTDPADTDHLAGCEQCRTELEALSRIIQHGRGAPNGATLDTPSEAVWTAIQAELGFIPVASSWPSVPDSFPTPAPRGPEEPAVRADSSDPATPIPIGDSPHALHATSAAGPADSPAQKDTGARGTVEHGPASGSAGRSDALDRATDPATDRATDSAPDRAKPEGSSGGSARSNRGRRGLSLVLAAAIALVAGIGLGFGLDRLRQPTETVIDRATLQALPDWPGAGGTASVQIDGSGNRTLVVQMHTDQPISGDQQVWLANQSITAMQPMGFLTADGSGRWPIPPGLDLTRFPVVDVSDEPVDDPDPAHSGNSIVRGELQQ